MVMRAVWVVLSTLDPHVAQRSVVAITRAMHIRNSTALKWVLWTSGLFCGRSRRSCYNWESARKYDNGRETTRHASE